MPKSLAWLSVGLLIVIPPHYGAYQVFKVGEEFITARLPAEAVLLTAMAAFMHGRRTWAYLLVLLGGLLHPLMTIPVAAVLTLLALPERHIPRVLAIAAAAVALACLIAALKPIGPVALMDDAWLQVVHLRSNYLFLEHWPARSFERVILVLTTLGFMFAASRDAAVRRLVRSVGIVTIGGLLATLLTQVVPIVLLMQIQPWRSLWVATVVAILVLPLLIASVWRDGRANKATAALAACAWLLQDMSSHAAFLAPLALALWFAPQAVKARFEPYIVALAGLMACITAVWTGATAFTALTVDLGLLQEQAVVEHLRTMFGLASAAVASLFAVWCLATQLHVPSFRAVVAGSLLAIAVPLIGSVFWTQWVVPTLRHEASSAFEDWKLSVPRGTEVMWLWDPVSTWLLLERPNYLSYAQASGVVFSRETAITAARRAENLNPVAGRAFTLGAIMTEESLPRPLTLSSLRAICSDPDLGFVVSEDNVGIRAPSKEWPTRGRHIYLYDCRALRGGRAS